MWESRRVHSSFINREIHKISMSTEEELIRKVFSFDSLPTQQEVFQAKKIILKSGSHWDVFCREHGFFGVIPQKEVVDALINLIESLGIRECVEIGAGNGKLAYWLNKKSKELDFQTKVTPTDINPRNGSVLKLSCEEALDKFRPQLVLIVWAKEKEKEDSTVFEIIRRILDFPTVKYLIHLGNARVIYNTWDRNTLKGGGWFVKDLENFPAYPSVVDFSGSIDSDNALYIKK